MIDTVYFEEYNKLKTHPLSHQTEICKYLLENHGGKSRAVHSEELQRLFSLSDRSLRRRINALRQDGFLICSDQNGYYYADDTGESVAMVRRLSRVARGFDKISAQMLSTVEMPQLVYQDIKQSKRGRKR